MQKTEWAWARMGLALAAVCLVAAPAALLAQQQASQNGTQQGAPSNPAPASPPQDPNAFPEAESQAAAKKTQQPAPAQSQGQTQAPKADEDAFPEAESEAAAKKASADAKADREAAGSGAAGGDANGSSSRDKMKGLDLLGDHESRISNGAGGTIVDPKLAAKDVRVGQQYMGMGNFPGAYERFKEAVTVDPGNADAVFYLAEAGRKTGHLDEAAANYKLYLQVEGSGAKSKDAKKALAQLEGK